jgi:hypothetical protein
MEVTTKGRINSFADHYRGFTVTARRDPVEWQIVATNGKRTLAPCNCGTHYWTADLPIPQVKAMARKALDQAIARWSEME